MYSWKTIRTFCVVLLILPLIHLVILVSRETAATLNSSPTAWQGEMDAYIEQDERASLPKNPIVVIGGRRVALWRDLQTLSAHRPVLVRALGDATVNDLTHYHERLVGFYRPAVVVLLPGNSEFQVRDAKSAGELARAIGELVALDSRHDGQRLFYVFSPIKTTLYPADHDKIDEVGRRLRAWAGEQPGLRLLDANPLLAGPDGTPDPANFRSDGVNLNNAGYLRLSLLLERQLAADFPQDYPISTAR
ncbi:hypothetical protein [Parahaliea mediterranea]|uniref:SGNH hydrolase-type esterase domain-containing protein n=1 Tax=Parahaliea mediterranea TaxID=651086 RepID=A0A939DDC6_9GAMM|nr:hypothetical protein [Parahaliea mediterranea]MBN7795477.1 hypothetical protein [Parahaliea mediterranea]